VTATETPVVREKALEPALPASPPAAQPTHFRALGINVILKNVGELSRLFQMFFFIVVARRFGPVLLGDLSVLLMIGSSVGMFIGDLGINTTMIARVNGSASLQRAKIVAESVFWKTFLGLGSVATMLVVMLLTGTTKSWIDMLAISVISLGSVWLDFLAAITNGLNRLDAEVWLRAAYRGLVYGLGAIFALFFSLSHDLLAMAFAALGVLLASYLVVGKLLIPLPFRWTSSYSLLRESLPVWVTQLAQLTFLRFDLVILGLLHVVAREIGWYSAGWKVVDALTTVPASMAAAALPLMSVGARGSNIAAIAPRYLKAAYVLPLFVVLPLTIGADGLSKLLYGPGFSGTPHILRLLAWALIPIFIHAFLSTVAVAAGRQSQAARMAAITSVLGLTAAIMLVPKFGYQYMAIVCLTANSLYAAAMVYRFRDLTHSMHVLTAIKSLASALAIFAVCLFFLKNVPWALLVIGGMLAYSLSLVTFGVVNLGHVGQAWRFFSSLLFKRPAGQTSPA
jgi:O-antigen/teichoic acid export membrane protein